MRSPTGGREDQRAPAPARQPPSSCPPRSMPNCGRLPRDYAGRGRGPLRCSRPRWCMRRFYGLPGIRPWRHRARRTCARCLPRPCGGFWWIMPAASRPASAAASEFAWRSTSGWLTPATDEDLLDLDALLMKLAELDPRTRSACRATDFRRNDRGRGRRRDGLSKRTAEREWTAARAWLRRELAPDDVHDS